MVHAFGISFRLSKLMIPSRAPIAVGSGGFRAVMLARDKRQREALKEDYSSLPKDRDGEKPGKTDGTGCGRKPKLAHADVEWERPIDAKSDAHAYALCRVLRISVACALAGGATWLIAAWTVKLNRRKLRWRELVRTASSQQVNASMACRVILGPQKAWRVSNVMFV